MKCSPFPQFGGPMRKAVIRQLLICLINTLMCLLYSSIITVFITSSHPSLASLFFLFLCILLSSCIVVIIVKILLSFHCGVFKFPFNFLILISPFLVVVTSLLSLLYSYLFCFVLFFLPFLRHHCNVY